MSELGVSNNSSFPWIRKPLRQIFQRIKEKNKGKTTNVLTISAQYGLISQRKFFNKSVAGKNLDGYYYLTKGDFAYNKSYSEGYPLGVIKRLERYDDGIVSPLYICFKLKNLNCDGDFYKYFFESNLWNDEVRVIAKEGGRSHGLLNVGLEDFFNISVPVPPLPEQRKIAAILTSVDEAIEKTEAIIKQTEKIKKGLMQHLLTKGIGHTEFKKTEIGEIPVDWDIVPLGNVLDLMTDYVANGSFRSLKENVTVYDNEEYALYVRLFDLRIGLGHSGQKYVDKASYDFLSKSSLYGNEILIANIGANVGEVFLMPQIDKPATIAPNMIVMRVNKANSYKFVYYYLSSPVGQRSIRSEISGSGQPKLNKTGLKKVLVAKPPKAEQEQIAQIISSVDEKIQKESKTLRSLQGLKRGLMQVLLTGKVRVKVDEAAEVVS